MSYADAKKFVHEHFMLQLKEAKFDTKEKALAGKCSCLECTKRTGNQKELFPDVSGADICTDPACFAAKKSAFTQRVIDTLKKEGKKVLSEEETAKVFPYASEHVEGNYVGLEQTCYEDPKRRVFSQLIKYVPDAQIAYAVGPVSGNLIPLLEKSEAVRIIKKLGLKTSSGGSGDRSKDLAKAKAENRVETTRQRFWREKLLGMMKDRRCLNVVLLFIALREMGYGEKDEFIGDVIKDAEYTAEKLYNLGDEKIKALLDKAALRRMQQVDVSDCDLKFLCDKLGFSMAKDYVITKEYLEAMTKGELAKLDRELGLGKESKENWKKGDLVEFIFKNAPKGKVPKELTK
jgi:hypothetical protein